MLASRTFALAAIVRSVDLKRREVRAGAVSVALPESMAASYGDAIRAVAPTLRLVSVASTPSDLSEAEVLLHGFWWEGPDVGTLISAMPRLRWVHSTGAGSMT